MKRSWALVVGIVASLGLALPSQASGQSNDNDYTPLNSRIRRDRQFPLEPPPKFIPPAKMGKAERDWTRSMMHQFDKCIYNRSKTGALDLLDKTDYGFVDFKQIGLAQDRALKIYGFEDCLERVAESNSSGVALRFDAGSLRLWFIEAAYSDRFPDGPSWLKPGYAVQPRTYPISAGNPGVEMVMDFADCVVAADPNNADAFFRAPAGSPIEAEAIKALTPSLGPCLPSGIRLQLSPGELRAWIAEGLWQAANHSVPAPVEPAPASH